MEIKNLQREKPTGENRPHQMNIRCSDEDSKWMKEKNISPTKLFHTALEELKKKN